MTVEDNILYHFWTTISEKRANKCIKQVVIPESLKDKAFQFVHGDDVLEAHFGVSKSFERLRLHFF